MWYANMPVDTQSAVIAELKSKLAEVPVFGAEVVEDFVLRVIDSDDTDLPDSMIIIQPGVTQEEERSPSTVKERVTLNITLITRLRSFAADLRKARVDVKVALSGNKMGLATSGVVTAGFQPETPMPGEGRGWSCHVMPLQITYVQQLK